MILTVIHNDRYVPFGVIDLFPLLSTNTHIDFYYM